MDRGVVLLAVAVGSAALIGASRPEPGAREVEVARLVEHFDSVDTELRSRDVSSLTAEQRANRAKLVSWLRDYRNSRTFPENDRFAAATPFFRDRNGVLCAMAYLIDRSGSSDIVNKVAAARNNAYIRELVDDPALVAWLDKWGLTAGEAARIQPAYGGIPDDPPREEVDDDFALAAIALGGGSLAATAVNFVKPTGFGGFFGLLVGSAAIIAGASNIGENDPTDKVAATTLGLGAVSVGAGVYALLDSRRDDRDHWRDRERRRRGMSMKILPDVVVQRTEPRVGVFVNGRF